MAYYNRKHIRLKNYDYSQCGYYYVTIHTANNEHILSTVGRGLAPASYEIKLTDSPMEEVSEPNSHREGKYFSANSTV